MSSVSRPWIVAAGVLAVCLLLAWIYWPAIHGPFLWDDDTTLTHNPLIQSNHGLVRCWSSRDATDYWPVTESLLWIEWRIWGSTPFAYHLTNLFLHLAEILLFWRVLAQLEMGAAFLGALLFSLHPLNVESVAWIAQTKNLVALLFLLTATWAYLHCSPLGKNPGLPSRRPWFWYSASLAAFTLALLSKGSVAPFPAVLAMLIWWRRPIVLFDVWRLVPFFATAVILALVNIWFQTHGHGSIRIASPADRLLGAGSAIGFYGLKTVWPSSLLFIFPLWNVDSAKIVWWLPTLGLAAATCLLMIASRDRAAVRSGPYRAAFAAWAAFALFLIPAIGLTDVGFMQYSLVASHYAQLSLLAAAALAAGAWKIACPTGTWWTSPRGLGSLGAAGAVILALVTVSRTQAALYADPAALYSSTIGKNPDCWVIRDALGVVLLARNRPGDAADQFSAAHRLRPGDADIAYNWALALREAGRVDEAMRAYRAAAAIGPNRSDVYDGIGLCDYAAGRFTGAAAAFRRAAELSPADVPVRIHLGYCLIKLGAVSGAVEQLQTAVTLGPTVAEAHLKLAVALAMAGDTAGAVVEHDRGMALKARERTPRQ